MSDIFISHSTVDVEAAEYFQRAFEAAGLACWISPRDIPPGKDWQDVIVDAIDGAKAIVLVYSGNAAESNYVQQEIRLANAKGKHIIPIKLDDTPPAGCFDLVMSNKQCLFAQESNEETYELVARYVIAALQERPHGLSYEQIKYIKANHAGVGVGTEKPDGGLLPPGGPKPEVPEAPPVPGRTFGSLGQLWTLAKAHRAASAGLVFLALLLSATYISYPYIRFWGSEFYLYPELSNLRTGPDITYSSICTLSNTEKLVARWLDFSPTGHPWMQVKSLTSNVSGFVSAKLLTREPQNDQPAFSKAVVTTMYCPVFQRPMITAPKIKMLKAGDRTFDIKNVVNAEDESWYHIRVLADDDVQSVDGYILIGEVKILVDR